MKQYDVAVIGLQLTGAGALYSLSKRKIKVAGFDMHNPPHNLGSSHGDSRIYRQAIGEGDFHTPFALRSHDLFRELENHSDLEMLTTNGGLIMVSENDESDMHGKKDFIGETKGAAEKYNILGYEILDTAEIHKRFPQFNLVGDEVGYYEPTAGFLKPENAIMVELNIARERGVDIYINEGVLDIVPRADGVKIKTSKDEYFASKVILSVGPWISRFLTPALSSLFQVHRQVVFYWDIINHHSSYKPDNFPVFIWQRNSKFIYGFPAIDGSSGGIKLASDSISPTHPDLIKREFSFFEVKNFYNSQVRDYFPDLSPACLRAYVCMYTSTPDRLFIVDTYPSYENVIIASPCSGHGAKHSPAIGESVAELAIEGKTTLDISPFSLKRFGI